VADSSLRIDILTGRQVIVAPQRSQRPGASIGDPTLVDSVHRNPFAEGNEQNTPEEHLALRQVETAANASGWLVRVVPNQFPAVVANQQNPERTDSRLCSNLAVSGIHDIVIESPRPHHRLVELSSAETARILLGWLRRVRRLEENAATKSITVFRNEGFSAGASLPHIHSQIIALNTIPPQAVARFRQSAEHRRQTGSSLLHDLYDAELSDGNRIISANADCVTMCPYAGRVSWQVRIAPRKSVATSFSSCPESVMLQIAGMLHASAVAIDNCAGPLAMNLLLVQPSSEQSDDGWFLDLMPRPARMAGFELATDVDIVTVSPEAAAESLRNVFQADEPLQADVVPPGYHWCDKSATS
jgi:UDPglucose--hexose-1-phosphate uridylyltransferase